MIWPLWYVSSGLDLWRKGKAWKDQGRSSWVWEKEVKGNREKNEVQKRAMPSKASSLPKSWLEPKIPGHSSACQHISVNPTGKICLILLGCRFAPLSLPYITLTRIPVVVILFTASTAYHCAQGNLHKNTLLTKRRLLSFEVNCSKARKLFCRLHSHPSSHGWIMIGPLIAWSQAIFSFLRQKSFRAGLLGGNSKDQHLTWQTAIWFFFLTVQCVSLGLAYLQVIQTQND